jgi:hypothetical protein
VDREAGNGFIRRSPLLLPTEDLQDLRSRGEQVSSVSNQRIRALSLDRLNGSRDSEDLESQVERVIDGDNGPALTRGLDHDDPGAQPRDDPVPARKVMRARPISRRKFADEQPPVEDLTEQISVTGRVDAIEPAAKNGDGAARPRKRTPMRGPVDPQGESAHDRNPNFGKL